MGHSVPRRKQDVQNYPEGAPQPRGKSRSKALETLSAAAKGENPASAAKKETTFGEVAENYLRIEGKNIRSAALYRRTLDRLVLPELGKRPIGRIRRSQIVNLIDVIAEEHAVMADLTFAIVRRVFTWHAGRDDHFSCRRW